MDFRRFRAAIVDADLDQNVLGRFLGVFHEHIEIAVLVKHAGVEQLVLEFVAVAVAVGADQLIVGIRRLRIFVEILHVGMRRRAVEIEVIFLHVLAVIALAVGQTEQALLENRDPCRSTARAQNKAAGGRRKCPPDRPRPSDRRGSGPDRG